MNRKGIDVSKHQGSIDWSKVKAAGIEFAMLRAGYGREATQKDPCFEDNYAGAKAAGIPVGAYWYSYAVDAADAKKEAAVCLASIAGKQFAYPVVYDVEDKCQDGYSQEQLTDIVVAFCEEMEKAGYYVMVYANKHWLENKLDYDRIKCYDIWLAQWADKATWGNPYGIWQYSNSGTVDGINKRVDLDIAYKDYPNIIKEAGLNGFGAEAKPEPPKPSEPIKPSSGYKVGDKVILNGPVYGDSYGGGKGKTFSGRTCTVTRTADGRKCPVHVDELGWVTLSSIRKAGSSGSAAPVLRVGAKVQYSGPLYGDSYGGGKGKTVSGTYTVSRIIKDRKCGVLLNDGLGWVPAGGCKVVG